MERVKAKKYLGQHFLTDLSIARRIAEAVSGAVVGGEVCCEPTLDASPTLSRKVVSTPKDGGWGAEKCPVLEIGGGRNGDNGSARALSELEPCLSKQLVLEIGGGMGVLTQFLLRRDDIELWGIEIDRDSIAYMREHFPDFSPRLIEGDFLRFDLRKFVGGFVKSLTDESSTPPSKGGANGHSDHENITIVGNFPYNISSQIFFKVLENRELVPEVVGMVQREVAQRIAEPPGSRTYGILSVLLQAWYDIEYLFTVSEGVFSPPPKVKSAVIRLRRNSRVELGCDEELFVRVVKAAFGQRRKMLRNALRSVFPDLAVDGLVSNIGAFGISDIHDGSVVGNELNSDSDDLTRGHRSAIDHPFLSRRAETLSVEEFVELTNFIGRRLT